MAVKSIRVVRLTLQETGTYNIQYYRPYMLNVTRDSMDKLTRRVESTMLEQPLLTPGQISGLGEDLVLPQATPQAAIAIPGGWESKRMRFVLEIELESTIGTKTIYYIQGYTNTLGVSHGGHLDPNMLFYMNSIFMLNRRLQQTPSGMHYVDSLQNCSHLLVSPSTMDPTVDLRLFTLRPVDLFSFMQLQLTNTGNFGMNGYDIGNLGDPAAQAILGQQNPAMILDTRLMAPNDFYRPSRRSNNSPLQYLSDVINTGVMGHVATSSHMASLENGISQARNLAIDKETKVSESDFLSILNRPNFQSLGSISSIFNLQQLAQVDPNLAQVTNLLQLNPEARAQLHQANLTSSWIGSDRDTQIAVMLANAIPTIMSDCLISGVHFLSTNHAQNGAVCTQIINGKSLSNTQLVHMFEHFRDRVERELINDFTYGNQIPFTLNVHCDMFGETKISISTDNNPETMYVVPSFCDALMTPVANVDAQRISKEAMSAGMILDTVLAVSRDINSETARINSRMI